jgi:arsenite-transporting ATPase
MVIAEARRTYTYLSLFGYRVDAVVVNRIIPDEVADPYFGKWKDIQAEHLATVHESFQPIPILTSRLFDRELVGSALLAELGAEVYGDLDAMAILHTEDPMRVRKKDGDYVLSIRLPFVERTGLNVFRKADELFVRIGSYKRNVILPQVLMRLEIQEASFVDDRLEVRFGKPDATEAPTGSDQQEGEQASG